ncbi:MAG TPA: galactokinase family protein, partial [Methanomicrobiales archaeon]|nr:galactokinase family protein [Methanomicrobiales archaeon]
MATWSAPGKVFLFGEHAVVYGQPGMAMAIRPRVYVTVRKSRRSSRINSPYIEQCFKDMGVRGSIYVHSQLPSSSGLGSSAAVTVATLFAINDEFNLGYSRDNLADIAFSIEKKVQKGRASPTDTYVSSWGGLVLITDSVKRRLPPQNLPIVVGNSR